MPDTPHQIERAIRAYFAQLSFIDNQLNRLVHALQERRVLGDTALVFTGDHGEMLYDHRRIAKSVGNEASARVPLMIRLPRGGSRGHERRVAAPVELRDLLPTICGIGGVEVPDSVDGENVVPLAAGDTEGWRPHLHGEHYMWGMGDNHWLSDGRTKYIREVRSGQERLFDLVADPQECRDLAAERPAAVVDWRAKLIEELRDRPEGFVVDGELTTEPAAAGALVPGVFDGDGPG